MDPWCRKNAELKITPYLVPYEELTEDIKELDRDTIRGIPSLLHSVGLEVFKRDDLTDK